MADRFFLQIARADRSVVHIPGGGALEHDLVTVFTDAICARASATFWDALGHGLRSDLVDLATAAIVAKGVGFLKTKAQVTVAIREGLADSLDQALRAQRADRSLNTYVSQAELRQSIADGIQTALQTLKDETRFAVGGR